MIGLQKQGKTLFYRDFLHHLAHSRDAFDIAPGIKGMVMCVFTLPSYPYVFKLIKDRIDKDGMDHATVRRKYQMVKLRPRRPHGRHLGILAGARARASRRPCWTSCAAWCPS